MNTKKQREDRGVALLLVVTIIALLTVVVLEFNRRVRYDLVDNYRFRERTQLLAMADSGIDLGLAVLLYDSYYNNFDCLSDPWAHVLEEVVTDFGSAGSVRVAIDDLSGRFPLNSLVKTKGEKGAGNGSRISPDEARKILIRLLDSGYFAVEDREHAEEIADSLTDWLDSDDEVRDYGAESFYYQSLEPPYQAANGPMQTPYELAAVKGVTQELLFGNEEKEGLIEYITVFGMDGRINLNTADEKLISVLHEDLVIEDGKQLVAYREKEETIGRLADARWYRSVPGWPGSVELDAGLVTTASSFFTIVSTARLGDTELIMRAWVRRSGTRKLEIVYRKTE